ncbi:hypothetical protein, variant 1 [Aphanomyces astaci]|uniref:PX domain-containing protein n=1 Tax=Aphanomyces astaci TaxID=112090 RepID=W4GQ15_APHAT|nr:hypothetical protein, variant 1 [Aphanomyces astaci]ETV81830.1 hypothetical protein, variant 1 [Aphanomyces astaci]|eukprot:XP_009828567.1 hypothetical protein, variant 1 [Aphanomyces astaci]
MDPFESQARELGRVEGRAEALEEIASLHAQIASLYGQIEDMALSQEGRTKALMSDVYKEIKATFKQHTELLAPKQVVEICKPSLRRVAELHLGNITRIPESDTPTTSSPRSQLHRSQTCAASMNTTAESSMHEVPSRRNSAPSPISTDAAALHRSEPPSDDLPPTTIVSISGSEKIGTGHSAYMVYWIVVHRHGVGGDAGATTVKRRFKDFAWLWERLSIVYPCACIPSLPPKSSLLRGGQSRFQPAFTERRRRLLERWVTYISLHDALSKSPYTHSFLHDAILHPDSIALPRSTTPSSSSSIMINSTKAMGPAHAKQRMNQSYKSLLEAVPPLQRRLQMVTKQSDEVVQAHVAMATAVEAMRRHCDIVQSFEHSYETPTKHENSVADVWGAWRDIGSSHARLHQDTATVWEVHLQEPFAFHHIHVLPRFERQVHELGKDMTATNVDKVAVEWDELSVVRAKTLVANLVQGAMQLEARHGAMRDEWTALRQHLVDTSHPMWKVRVRQQSREEVPPLVHPTLGRPLKPWAVRPDEEGDGDVDVEAAAALFGVAGYAGPARRRRREDGETDEATAARTLFGGEEDEEGEASSDDGGKPIEKPPVVPGDWDLYIERLRRKQLTKAKRAFAAASQEQQAADEEAAAAATARKTRKRPQSLNWPGKRSSHLRLDERVKQQQQQLQQPLLPSEPEATLLPPQPVRTTSLPATTTATTSNWIQVQTDAGQVYYYHKLTRATRWTKPDHAVLESIEERLLAQHEATQRRLEVPLGRVASTTNKRTTTYRNDGSGTKATACSKKRTRKKP